MFVVFLFSPLSRFLKTPRSASRPMSRTEERGGRLTKTEEMGDIVEAGVAGANEVTTNGEATMTGEAMTTGEATTIEEDEDTTIVAGAGDGALMQEEDTIAGRGITLTSLAMFSLSRIFPWTLLKRRC